MLGTGLGESMGQGRVGLGEEGDCEWLSGVCCRAWIGLCWISG